MCVNAGLPSHVPTPFPTPCRGAPRPGKISLGWDLYTWFCRGGRWVAGWPWASEGPLTQMLSSSMRLCVAGGSGCCTGRGCTAGGAQGRCLGSCCGGQGQRPACATALSGFLDGYTSPHAPGRCPASRTDVCLPSERALPFSRAPPALQQPAQLPRCPGGGVQDSTG